MAKRYYRLAFEVGVPAETEARDFEQLFADIREALKGKGIRVQGPYARERLPDPMPYRMTYLGGRR